MNTSPFILASASPRRADLLRQAGYEFQVIPGQAEEIQADFFTPHELCRLNAFRKARCVAREHPEAVVLGADTLVFKGLQIFGKPRDMSEATRILSELGGQTHEVVTGVCLARWQENRKFVFSVSTRVRFRPLSREVIEQYLAKVNPLDKAGAYAIQEEGDMLVAEIAGSYSNVVGLPLEAVQEQLEHWGLPATRLATS